MPGNDQARPLNGYVETVRGSSERRLRDSEPFRSRSFNLSAAYGRAGSSEPLEVAEDRSALQEEFEMSTVADIFGHQFPNEENSQHPLIVGTHRVGIEVELENIRTSFPASRNWRVEGDGSLRNHGAEFVFRNPLGGRDLFHAIVELDSHLFENNPDASWRCSTHVHLDVRDMDANQLKNLFIAYIVYERVLFRCSGWHRLKNNFCPALCFAQQMLEVLSLNWHKRDDRFMNGIRNNWDKYSAMNVIPMGNYGSVEFRMSEAKWRKGHLIKHCNRLLSLKELAMGWDGTQEELISHLVGAVPTTVIKKGLPKDIGDITEDLEIGAKLAFDVLNMAELRRKSAESRREVLGNLPDDSPRFQPRNRTNEEVMNIINGNRHIVNVLWWNRDAEALPDEMSYHQLAELMYHCGVNRRWVLPSAHAMAYDEFYSTWLNNRNL